MFARWRNLAAAAGAIWFPFASAQATPDRNELRYDTPCTRPGACAEYQDRAATNRWQTYDRESWYEQYYRNSLNDPTTVSIQLDNSPSPASSFPIDNDDSFSSQSDPNYNEPEFRNTDDPAATIEPRIEDARPAVDSDGRCDDPTCPCHDIIALDSDDQSSPPKSASFSDSFCPANPSMPGCFDVYESYSFEDESSGEPLFEVAPALRLSGTIEPIFEESDNETIDDSFEQSPERTIEPRTIFDDESTSTHESADDAIEETQDATEDFDNDSSAQRSRYHMFYPGCDWSPYDPLRCGQPTVHAVDQIESSVPDSNAADSQELTFEVD